MKKYTREENKLNSYEKRQRNVSILKTSSLLRWLLDILISTSNHLRKKSSRRK